MSGESCCEVARPTVWIKIKWRIDTARYWYKGAIKKAAMMVVRWTAKDCNYRKHALREFEHLGWPGDSESQKWICDDILDLLAVFSGQGHSGTSAPYAINLFKKIASFEPIAPITGEDSEWGDCISHDDHYQNKRLSAVFKEGKDAKPYYLHAITWRNQNGSCYGGSALDSNNNRISSRQFIKLPFTPKTFYIDVVEKEIAKDDFEFYVKDESQLNEVFEYYEKS